MLLATTAALRGVASTLSLDAKRRPSKGGMTSWYPYYAGFSDTFARHVLKSVPLNPGATVLDPWNGSGTTTHVADQLGFRALGFDVNPVASLVANAKLARPRDAEHVLGLATRIAESAKSRSAPKRDTEPLTEWLKPSVANQYRVIEAAVLADLATGRTRLPMEPRSGTLPPLASFLVLALMRAARSLAGVRTSTNPTWIVPGEDAHGSRTQLGQRWLANVEAMADDLSCGTATFKTASETQVADACSLPIPDASVDLALTSPPYCTRIDYVVSTSFELAALGVSRGSAEYDHLRRACMGTPLARRGSPLEPRDSWPKPLTVLLNTIRNHPSKASRSYYYKTYWQYFSDCERALGELYRTLKPGGAAVLVVQSSYYKDVEVDLPQLYVELGESLGFAGHVVNRVEVRRALAQINSRSNRHRAETNYFESVVTLEKAA